MALKRGLVLSTDFLLSQPKSLEQNQKLKGFFPPFLNDIFQFKS